MQVLESHGFLGSLPTLGADINTCFGDAIEVATLRAVQQVVNSGRAGGNPKAGQATKAAPLQLASMHDAAKLLPPELFSAALSRVRLFSRAPAWMTALSEAVHGYFMKGSAAPPSSGADSDGSNCSRPSLDAAGA